MQQAEAASVTRELRVPFLSCLSDWTGNDHVHVFFRVSRIDLPGVASEAAKIHYICICVYIYTYVSPLGNLFFTSIRPLTLEKLLVYAEKGVFLDRSDTDRLLVCQPRDIGGIEVFARGLSHRSLADCGESQETQQHRSYHRIPHACPHARFKRTDPTKRGRERVGKEKWALALAFSGSGAPGDGALSSSVALTKPRRFLATCYLAVSVRGYHNNCRKEEAGIPQPFDNNCGVFRTCSIKSKSNPSPNSSPR